MTERTTVNWDKVMYICKHGTPNDVVDQFKKEIYWIINQKKINVNTLGDYNTALEYYQKTQKLQEKSLRPSHPSLAATYNNIADIQRKLGNNK
ncbi:unnamed protein product, partial [Rotaria sordida]